MRWQSANIGAVSVFDMQLRTFCADLLAVKKLDFTCRKQIWMALGGFRRIDHQKPNLDGFCLQPMETDYLSETISAFLCRLSGLAGVARWRCLRKCSPRLRSKYGCPVVKVYTAVEDQHF